MSGPDILMPIGLLMPVASMSMRLRIGGTKRLVRPGTCTAASSSCSSFSMVMPGRHSLFGLKVIVVSNISSGAGSVAVSRSEEHTSELQSLMRISYAVFCLQKKTQNTCTKHKDYRG